ncbi:DUF6596 domain-containing protein [Agrococcus sp. SGAir0287]|uniref:DUF6596 domain-containing protein n=1 Tax=Agrococcus sp. SGAir0287 TaxID=2070347 RepID=UPI0010CD5816|nr:DUF6596 domain-containing protein [Agrococcus sp. SGAir0287]QCR18641.1 hypothetical protein C1N71_03565 [Agrococcus sp. SGAir0287]
MDDARIEPAAFQEAWPQVVRALAAATGSIDEGEELAAEAFARAAAQSGPPASLVGWCIAVGRRAAIDAARRRATERVHLPALHDATTEGARMSAIDDRVALLLVACDELLPPVSRMVLAMRLVLGVDVDAIAAHLGLERGAAAARLTRAKRLLAEERGAFHVPTGEQRERRMPVVLDCVHGLVAIGQRLVPEPADAVGDLVAHAERIAEALVRERTDDAEARAVLAIARLALARRPGRVVDGVAVAPEAVDRRGWDARRLALGIGDALAASELAGEDPGRFALEARIAALHSAAPAAWDVPWPRVARLHRAVEARWPARSATLARLVAEAYALLVAAGIRDASDGRLSTEPDGMARIREQVAALDDGARATGRDVDLVLADLAWRTRAPDAAARYRALAVRLADDAVASDPVRAFCASRAQG